MVDSIYLITRTIHFIAMALWIGFGIYAGLDARTSIAAGPSNFPALRERQRRVGPIMGASGFLTLITGIVMIFCRGGFAHVSHSIHAGLLTGILASGVGALGVGGTWSKIDKMMADGKSAEDMAPLLRRISMLSKVFQTLWLITLLLMVFRPIP
jgi:hypothetical protein